MSCCGRRQPSYHLAPSASSAPGPASPSATSPGAATFVYIGRTGLTAVGKATGARYRFARPGARVAVDERDASGLQSVPVLRRLGRSEEVG